MRTATLVLSSLAAAALAAPAMAQNGEREVRIVRTPGAVSVAGESSHRAALGLATTVSGSLRDTLGLLVTSVTRGSPAERAGIEEGNRLAAINGTSLRPAAVDAEDVAMSRGLITRLTRELSKVKPGDEVELRVYRDGRTRSVRVRTADSDTLFRRSATITRTTQAERENRPTLGIGLGMSGSSRDTLGVLVISVMDSTPAARAGLEEGNRIAAINGVNLRVAHEDASDRTMGMIKSQRLQREVASLTPGQNVTLRVYGNGQFRDVNVKVARAADLPKTGNRFMIFGDDFGNEAMAPLPPTGVRTPIPPDAPRVRGRVTMQNDGDEEVQIELGPALQRAAEGMRLELERLRPVIEERIETLRPQLERLRDEIPLMLQRSGLITVVV